MTIPKWLRNDWKIRPGDKVVFDIVDDVLTMKPVGKRGARTVNIRLAPEKAEQV
jgi:bifunctional DNA-binding transcriptional regulator/antitoxin component of YhaV-PrlF toxin-antitoxin module